jgi:hypothetical protein
MLVGSVMIINIISLKYFIVLYLIEMNSWIAYIFPINLFGVYLAFFFIYLKVNFLIIAIML